MDNQLTFSNALVGFELALIAARRSKNTVAEYKNTFRKFAAFLSDDLPLAAITADQVTAFLAAQTTITNKTLLNYHVGLSSLWTWAVKKGYVRENVMHLVDRAKPEKRIVEPFTEAEIRALMIALTYTNWYDRPGKKTTRNRLPDADRNVALALLLLDTGIRATELCELPIYRVDLRSPNKSIRIMEGKGKKDRHIPFSARTGEAIWKYLASPSRKDAQTNDPLFVSDQNRALDRGQLAKILNRAGERAQVPNVHPHRFRHSFAVLYLRNGGDIFTLQEILGHSSLDMVKIYLQIAQTDVETAYRRASPVDNLHL